MEDDEWNLNSPERVKLEMSLQTLADVMFHPQAESTPNYGVTPAEVAYSSELPDGKLPYA